MDGLCNYRRPIYLDKTQDVMEHIKKTVAKLKTEIKNLEELDVAVFKFYEELTKRELTREEKATIRYVLDMDKASRDSYLRKSDYKEPKEYEGKDGKKCSQCGEMNDPNNYDCWNCFTKL